MIKQNPDLLRNTKMKSLLNEQTEQGDSALHLAVSTENYEACKLLLEEGADVNIRKTKNLVTPLHLASKSAKNIEIVKLLVANGANVNAIDATKETALHKASRNNRIEIFHYLLER